MGLGGGELHTSISAPSCRVTSSQACCSTRNEFCTSSSTEGVVFPQLGSGCAEVAQPLSCSLPESPSVVTPFMQSSDSLEKRKMNENTISDGNSASKQDDTLNDKTLESAEHGSTPKNVESRTEGRSSSRAEKRMPEEEEEEEAEAKEEEEEEEAEAKEEEVEGRSDKVTNALFKFESPSSTVIAGPSMAGKTVLALSILKHSHLMYTIPPEKILYAYGVYQKKFEDLEVQIPNLTLHHGLPSRDTLDELKSDEGHNLLVLDDLMDEICKSSEMCSLFTRDVHHGRISVMMLSQNVFHQSRYSRTISLNTSYLILMKTCRDLEQIHSLSRQMFPSCRKRLVEAYEDATRKPRTYLVVNNLTNSGDEDIRLSSCILPWETLVLYIAKKC